MNKEVKFTTIQKIVFFLTGFAAAIPSLALYYVFGESDNKRLTGALHYVRIGAITTLVCCLVAFVFGFLVGFLTPFLVQA